MTINMRRLLFIAALLGGMTARAKAGQIYDAAADFSIASNPNGVWSYGSSLTLGGTLSLYAHHDNVSGIDLWRDQTDPNVSHNGTNNAITINSATWQPGELAFHPGPNGQFSVIRFTAPTVGSYSLDAAFSGIDFIGPTTTDVHVLHNGTSIFDGTVLAYGPGPTFSSTISLSTGDTIDFAVGFGPDGNYGFDSTGIAATLTAVPEPSGLLMLTLGIGIVGAIRLGRRL